MKENTIKSRWEHPYTYNPKYSKRVAYFCMEYGIDQALKTYSGGLGFLTGSHMRSAFDLRQNMIGIGMLWKYGYYDQHRNTDFTTSAIWIEKRYNFLEDTGIVVSVRIKNNHEVKVRAYLLKPEIFNTIPIYFLSTDLPENDHMSQTITHKLYDGNHVTRIAQSIVLGIGGAKVVDALGGADVYHINEGHALPVISHLFKKYESLEEVKKRFVFTTHTPELAGNEERETGLLLNMGFFDGVEDNPDVKKLYENKHSVNYTLTALKTARIANGVSKIHTGVSREMWGGHEGICPIIPITNAQNGTYWQDRKILKAFDEQDMQAYNRRKFYMKKRLFKYVSDETGKIFDTDILTIVWARRFAGYKRANLITRDYDRFIRLIENTERPVQIIWAGKPYPLDQSGVDEFNELVWLLRDIPNCATLTSYELHLSKLLKTGSDVWLNNPRIPREASGTSGMTAAMNGSINFSTWDGWIAEFAKDKENCFVIPPIENGYSVEEVDQRDQQHLLEVLEQEIAPLYYDQPEKWHQMRIRAMEDVRPAFESDRMADEYYELLYNS
jgi:glycogen phosphorylase